MNKTTLNSQKAKHSMLSLRRATSLGLLSLKPHTHFYPRSPCGERPVSVAACSGVSYFYPRSPCGERHTEIDLNGVADLFLSTLSLRRATRVLLAVLDDQHDFYPRSPCGERPIGPQVVADRVGISIHALLAESDCPAAGERLTST